ncbi:hypothetical protein [Pseudomonas frederiksbergensis]|uniref:Integrase catalytic domain-containing protein n=1 Tax=Pseudomonas frederiksbergensis TaxID=104087 RepID=A0A423HWC6_9PSED|nr:hypothetical protein [Pseudomonas frederiksbergensis]RON17492.1 hypothetical protein BK662_07140 [Pseudomonas frederiksbergensis]
MNISDPKVGAQYKLDGQIYEVISINDNIIAMCSLVHKYRRFIERNDFASMEHKGNLFIHQRAAVDISPAARLISMPEAQRCQIRLRQTYVEACLNQLGGQLPREAAKKMIEQVAKNIGDEHPPGVSTVWRWKQRYTIGNHNQLALGRKKAKPRPKRIQMPTEELVRHYIETVYLRPERPSLTHAHKLLKGQMAKENSDRQKYGAPALKAPSYATFRRRVLAIDRYYVTEKREGTKVAKRLNKASGALFIDDDPYSCTIFDSHNMNVIVKDLQTGATGRALLSAHIVPATRENSGWDISLGAPCAEKMMRATIGAILKNGKMAGVVGDRGLEILNTWAITTFETLGIDPDYVPAGTPDAKATIERFFGTVSTGFCNNLPGTTKESPDARGDYDSNQRAILTLEQLRIGYASWLEIYHNTWHDSLYTSPAERKEQLCRLAPPAERYTEEELKSLCVSRWELRLSGGRVTSENLTWFGDGLPEIRQRLKAKQNAIVYFNPCDLGIVWVAHPDTPDDWHPATALRPEYQNGLTLSDHKLVMKRLLTEKKAFNADDALIALYELNEYIEICKKANIKTIKSWKGRTTAPEPDIVSKNASLDDIITGVTPPDETEFRAFFTRGGTEDESGTKS